MGNTEKNSIFFRRIPKPMTASPIYRSHLWQTPDARIAPVVAAFPEPPHIPSWMVASAKFLLGPTIYTRCKTAAIRVLTNQ